MIGTTHTFVKLEVSAAAYQEIYEKLAAAGFQHAFLEERDAPTVIDLHGLALVPEVTGGKEVMK